MTVRPITQSIFFFFNDTATTEIYTLSLHDALPIFCPACRKTGKSASWSWRTGGGSPCCPSSRVWKATSDWSKRGRSEEHTSELQSRQYLVCRLLLEKKKKIMTC